MATVSHPMMRALAAAIRSNTPVLLWGDPGVAKTALLEANGSSWGYHVETVVGSIREPADFLGLPLEKDGTVEYAPLAWAHRLADADQGLLFLDELTTCSPSVQKAMLRIVQERVVGEQPLPDSVAIVAAANPPDIAVDGWDLAAPTANRFVHLDWHFDMDGWLDGVVTDFVDYQAPDLDGMLSGGSDVDHARVRGQIAAFCKHRPDMVKQVPTDPAAAGRAWPSPRSWTNAMSVLAHLDRHDEDAALLVLKGCVGEAAATEFIAWQATSDLADPDQVMDAPSSIDWQGERPDRLFALTSSVGALATVRDTKKAWKQAVKVMVACAEGGKPDVALPQARTLLNNRPDGQAVPSEAREAFTDLFVKADRLEPAA